VQEVLDTNNLQAENRSDARKEKLEADAVWDLMGNAEQIVVAKGKKWKPLYLTKTCVNPF
jgi:hypothetical protein